MYKFKLKTWIIIDLESDITVTIGEIIDGLFQDYRSNGLASTGLSFLALSRIPISIQRDRLMGHNRSHRKLTNFIQHPSKGYSML